MPADAKSPTNPVWTPEAIQALLDLPFMDLVFRAAEVHRANFDPNEVQRSALLSINLGLINLLPIPMLDGGHLVMYAMEKVRGKPLNEQVQEYALRVGIAFLLGIMVFATWNDLVQLKFVDYVVKLVS